ncbi:hypothetical protein BVRB_9g224660 [Beta vulgaris subsp. vulgaris]|uniref:Uncharacterized protein n=1 Tax=Beta vulgaris subsp. vulgaris TaxID=3555 RepID=A0A0J8B918_BETVV|nr:hypothetical protein BVRB_9g224660 [Beta vulgaris subsp. vulgaris]
MRLLHLSLSFSTKLSGATHSTATKLSFSAFLRR